MDGHEFAVRRFGTADAALVLSCERILPNPPSLEWTEDFLSRGANYLLAAEAEGEIVGLLAATEIANLTTSPDLLVYDIRVDKRVRGRGIAHELVSRIVELAEEAGCVRVRASVSHGEGELFRPWEEGSRGTRVDKVTSFVIPLD